MDYQKIKSFEDACNALSIDTAIPDFSATPAKHQKALVAHYKIVIIVEAVNEGWQPNWADNNEWKYELWPDVIEDKSKPSGFGLSYGDYDVWGTTTSVGSRLCFKNSDLAKYAGTKFAKLYAEAHLYL